MLKINDYIKNMTIVIKTNKLFSQSIFLFDSGLCNPSKFYFFILINPRVTMMSMIIIMSHEAFI